MDVAGAHDKPRHHLRICSRRQTAPIRHRSLTTAERWSGCSGRRLEAGLPTLMPMRVWRGPILDGYDASLASAWPIRTSAAICARRVGADDDNLKRGDCLALRCCIASYDRDSSEASWEAGPSAAVS